MLAVRIWRLGYAMLRREAKAEEEALALRRFAVRLNVVALGIAAALVVLGGVDLAGVSLVLVVYGAVSFAHAAALGRCAKLLAEERGVSAAVPRQRTVPSTSEQVSGPRPR
jgi:hypothetical protein